MTMTEQEQDEFRGYLENCTNNQVQGVYDKEKAAGRREEMALAVAEAKRRGIELNT
jgi:hypothetical protein